jgi:DNA-binding response OmpR family regulator
VVEDDHITSGALRAIFERRGWNVTIASTLAEAYPILDSQPDCVILDLMLPDGDGVEILARVRATGLPIRVAVTTGSSDFERLRAVADLRPDILLSKPISLEQLLAAVGP